MRHPADIVKNIDEILTVLDGADPKGASLENYDALHAIRHVLGRKSKWEVIGEATRFKRRLKKNSVTV
jgi:hypothetical protein